MVRLVILLFPLLFMGCGASHQALYFKLDPSQNQTRNFFDLKSSSYYAIPSMADRLASYTLIFIGDHHNEDDLHQKIQHLIEALQKKGKRVVLANEWFTPDDNELLKAWTTKALDEKTFLEKIDWKKRIGFAYKSFKPIYNAVIEGKGSLVGINLTKKEQKKISERDFDAMNNSEKAFYQALDLDVYIHQDMLKPFFQQCHAYSQDAKEDCSQRMYRVQVAWDSKMAQSVYNNVKKLQKDELLIVLSGAMHLENGLGINLRFSRLSHHPFLTLIPRPSKTKKLPLGVADSVVFYKEKGQEKP